MRSLTICQKEVQSLSSASLEKRLLVLNIELSKKGFQPAAKLPWTKRAFWSIWSKPQGFWTEAESDRGRTGLQADFATATQLPLIWREQQFQAAVYWDCSICAEADASLQRGSSVSPGYQEPSHITAKGRLVPSKGSPDAASCTVLATSCAL